MLRLFNRKSSTYVQYTQKDTIRQFAWSIGTNGWIGTDRKVCHSNGSVGEYASHYGVFDYFPNFDGPLVPIENDDIPMVLLVQNKFAFTPSSRAI